MADKPKKARFDKLGYGAMALYVSLLAVCGLGVYGINVGTLSMEQNRSDRAREQVRTGRMVVSTQDRTQCRSIRFNNETSELGNETLIDCDARSLGLDGSGSYNTFRSGFMNR